MTTNDILDLDYRQKESKKIIQKCLCRIKPFAKYSDEKIPIEMLEKYICKVSIKYEVYPQYIIPTYIEHEIMQYSMSLRRTDTKEWLGSIYACCIYELMAKTCIKLYSDVKAGNIPER